jgi:hypothetical protein
MHEKLLSVARYDAGGLLAPMLERVKAEVREIGSLLGSKHAKYSTLIVEMIVVPGPH